MNKYFLEIKARQNKRIYNESFYKHNNKKIKKLSHAFSYGTNIYERNKELEEYIQKCGIEIDYINY